MYHKSGWLFLGIIASLLLSACGGFPSGSPTPTLPSIPTVDTKNGTIPATGEACLVGGWAVDNSQIETGWIESRVRRLTGQQLNIREIDGGLVVQFLPDGQAIGYAQGFDLQTNLQGQGIRIPIQVRVDGLVQATYRSDDANQVLTISGPVNGWEDVTINARALIVPIFNGTAGELVQAATDTEGSVELDYDCSGDSLQITVDEPVIGRKTFRLDRVQ